MIRAALVLATVMAAAVPPAPARWVTDEAAFLSPSTRQTLDARLESYQHATGHQVVVWIGTTLDGAALDDWAVRTFAAWQVGRKGLDDGLAVFIHAQDRTIDIEVGYGLEGQVPDVVASRIIRDVMTPPLQAGDRDGAVTAGVEALLTAVEGQPWDGGAGTGIVEPTDVPPWSTTQIVLGGLLLLGLIIFAITHPRMALWLLWTTLSAGRGGGGGFRGGGGGGGFRGGGGRSGGGGARGSW